MKETFEPPETTRFHVASEESLRPHAQAMPRTAGWSRPDADDGEGRSPGSRVAALIPSSWGGALRSQLRAQRRTFTGFPFHRRSTGGTFTAEGLLRRSMACQSRPQRLERGFIFPRGWSEPAKITEDQRHEGRYPSRLPSDQRSDEQRHHLPDALDLGPGRRH